MPQQYDAVAPEDRVFSVEYENVTGEMLTADLRPDLLSGT